MTSKITKIERYKKETNLKDYYAKLDLLQESNLSEADRFYLKNFGIYNSVLKPEHFMVRIRIPSGRIELKSLEAILNCAKSYKANITLTSRAQIELQNLTLDNAIKVHKLLIKNNITTFATLTDNIRNIVTHPLDGIAKESKIECYGLILQMQDEFIKIENLGKLSRKFNTAILGTLSNFEPFWANDCYFAPAFKDTIFGFKLYLGGKNTNFAQDLDIFVTKEDVVNLYRSIVKLYVKYGSRSSRTKARLHYLLNELGTNGFKIKLQEFYKKELISGAILAESFVEKEEFYKLKDNRYAYCYKSNFGEVTTLELEKIINYARENSLSIRLGVDQNIYIIGLKNKEIDIKSSAIASDAKVCVGLKYCGFSIYDTKEASLNINYTRLNSLNIKTSFSGCLKGCARHISADIGFVGIRTNLYGKKEFAVRLYLGAHYKDVPTPARLIYWAVPLRSLNRLLDTILDEFQESKLATFKEFSNVVLSRFSNEFLALHFLEKLSGKTTMQLKDKKEHQDPTLLYDKIKELERFLYS